MSFTTLLLALVAAPLLVCGVLLWRRQLLLALPILVVLNGLPITVRGTSLRIDQLAACLLVIPLGASILSGTRRLRSDSTTWWLASLLAANLTASLLNSPARAYSLAQCANLASAWVIYVLLLNFLETRQELEVFFTRCLWAAVIASSTGIVAFGLALAGISIGGAEVSSGAVEQLTAAYGASGTMVEPNIFGSFNGAYLVLTGGLLATVARRDSASPTIRLLRWTAVLTAAGLVLSFTRSAWIGATFGAACFLLSGGRTFLIRRRRILVPVGIGCAVLLVLLLLPGSVGTFLRFKLINLVNVGSRTAALRLLTYTLALQQLVEHPFIGWGTFTFAPLVAEGADFARFDGWRSLWIGNYLILALHDTGVVGLVLWVGMLWSVIARGIRTTRRLRADDPEGADRALALTSAVASLLISFLATTGFSLGYPWLLIGLLGAHAWSEHAPRDGLPMMVAGESSLPPRPADAT
ncbi:MAG: hypothetical protein JWM95_3507 [Gemmatimonadetes bacterium]|nr:hypothetical protein [Gemmatimonadota bacterium]